ncbi:tetratricopeptide repeat protein [Saccharopolyspora sp. K220]|uniref:tetratricopeptide repeat protein n=1 Tax=Saccharopolyspora soli TaxID=2926618 RepID=UPI001F561BCB|nr:tetratricopeptide repeat protein [Saccharopolyspora soli]MCI2415816.1 tetratricopeptide repeat protein [Saccharopolyspora soli]
MQAAALAKERVLLIVDYAETRSDLSAMLTEVAAQEAAGRTGGLRVLLLARHVGEWWTALDTTSDATRALTARTLTRELSPPLDAQHDNLRIFQEALPCYAKARGRPTPEAELPNSSEQLPVLVLHAAALVAVLDDEQGTHGGRAAADLGVLDRLLGHESRLWADTAQRSGVGVSLPVLEQVIAVLALLPDSKSGNESALRHIIRRVPDLADANEEKIGALARWSRQLYPAANGTAEVLRPDLLAERHAANQLAKHELLRQTCFTGLSQPQAIRALTVLTRACAHHDQAEGLLDEIVRANLPELADAMIIATAQTGTILGDHLANALTDAPIQDDTLRQIAAKIPYPTVALAPAALAVTKRIHDALPPDTDPAETAHWSNHLALAFAQLGRKAEALDANAKAVAAFRALAEAQPETHLPNLAASALNQSTYLWGLGRLEEAFEVSRGAVTAYVYLARTQPDIFFPDLAEAFANQSVFLSGLGRLEDALEQVARAVRIWRTLAEAQPDTYLPGLARALTNQSARLSELGRHEEAFEAATEAVTTYRALAEAQPDTYLPELAASLGNQSVYSGSGRLEEALDAATEAVTTYRTLAEAQPDTYLPGLARALTNQSGRLSELGRHEEALQVISESVRIWRALDEAQPDTFLPNLARALTNQSARLSDLGLRKKALEIIEEAITIWRILATQRPAVHQHQLDHAVAIRTHLNGSS